MTWNRSFGTGLERNLGPDNTAGLQESFCCGHRHAGIPYSAYRNLAADRGVRKPANHPPEALDAYRQSRIGRVRQFTKPEP